MPFGWPTAAAAAVALGLHQRAHNFKLARDATSEGCATQGGGGGRGSVCAATFHPLGLIGKASTAAGAISINLPFVRFPPPASPASRPT